VLSHQLGKRPHGPESISPPRDYPLPGLRPPAPTPHERLVTKRLERGWSRKVAARHLGIDVSTLRDWEQGKIILPQAPEAGRKSAGHVRRRARGRDEFPMESCASADERHLALVFLAIARNAMERFPSYFVLEQFVRGAIRGRKSGRLNLGDYRRSSRRSGAGKSRASLTHGVLPSSSNQGLSDRMAACW
jgi:hypothetical protein